MTPESRLTKNSEKIPELIPHILYDAYRRFAPCAQ